MATGAIFDGKSEQANLGVYGKAGLLTTLVGAVLMGIGWGMGKEVFAQAYLFAYICFASLVLGCLGVTLLHHTVRGSWGLSVLRLFEAGGGPNMIAAMAVLFVPIGLNMDVLYHHWMHPETPWKHWFKTWYLSQPRFLIAAAVYFVIWYFLAARLRASSLREDTNHDLRERQKRTDMSAVGLVVYMLTATMAVTDWVMSLDPHWFSAIMGAWFAVGSALMAIAMGTIIVCSQRNKEPYKSIISHSLTKDLGNMLFAFTMLWAYMTVSQWIILWSGNLPEFISFYLARHENKWLLMLGAFNVVFQFFVPWMLLLSPRLKRNPVQLMWVAVLALVMRFFDLFYNVMPFMRTSIHWLDFAAIFFLGSVWFWIFGTQTTKGSLYAEHDQRLKEAKPHAS